jgi:hypothetical protein
MITDQSRFEKAIAAFDEVNSSDPEYPKELLYAQRMTEWLNRLEPLAPESIKLAARSQHISRWKIPRESYPDGKKGYKEWRTELAGFHARLAGEILESLHYDSQTIEKVKRLIKKENLKTDPDTQLLEDVICLVFIEYYLEDFASQHEESKIVDIIQKTWRKMSERGHRAALEIKLSGEVKHLVERALKL